MANTVTGNIAILILFYNKMEQTADCINSFLPAGESIYVLNNGSPATDFIELQKRFQQHVSVKFMDAGKNLGPAGGRNYLISHTHEQWLVCVDNDISIRPEKEWKFLLQNFLHAHPQCTIVCPRIYNVHEAAYMDRLMLHVRAGKLEIEAGAYEVTNFFPEGGVIVNRVVFETYGLYDEGMFAFEGYELALRAMLSESGAMQVYFIPEIELIHDHQFQTRTIDKDAVKYRYNEQKHVESYIRIKAKHQIEFEHDWKWWISKQKDTMTLHPLLIRIKNKLKRVLGNG